MPNFTDRRRFFRPRFFPPNTLREKNYTILRWANWISGSGLLWPCFFQRKCCRMQCNGSFIGRWVTVIRTSVASNVKHDRKKWWFMSLWLIFGIDILNDARHPWIFAYNILAQITTQRTFEHCIEVVLISISVCRWRPLHDILIYARGMVEINEADFTLLW